MCCCDLVARENFSVATMKRKHTGNEISRTGKFEWLLRDGGIEKRNGAIVRSVRLRWGHTDRVCEGGGIVKRGGRQGKVTSD